MTPSPPRRPDEADDAHLYWERRLSRRRRADRIWQTLNGVLFLVLVVAVIAFVAALWTMVVPVYLAGS